MVLSEERLKILEMLQDGKINAEQAEGLLQALGEEKTTGDRQTARKLRLWAVVHKGDVGSGCG